MSKKRKAEKKKVAKKKVEAKKTTKKATAKKSSNDVVVRVVVDRSADTQSQALVVAKPKDLEPEKAGTKFMLVKSWMEEKQVLKILQKTPPAHIFKRPGKGGKEFHYVTGTYVKKVLNFVFGWNWDFEIVSEREVNLDIAGRGQIITRGKLTVKDGKGNSIAKEQYGRADVKYLRDAKTKAPTKEFVDLGNDYKAAATDALKKCAAEFGIASDVYGKEEFRDIGRPVEDQEALPQETTTSKKAKGDDVEIVPDPDFSNAIVCQSCDAIITPQEAEFSKKMFGGKKYCRDCQAIHKKK